MARQPYRANTLTSSFPLLSSFFGHSVVIPQLDQNQPRVNQSEDKLGNPQLFFCENVMPMNAGLQSIGFAQVIAPMDDPIEEATPVPVVRKFDQAFWLRNSQEKRTLFVPAHGYNYLYKEAPTNNWESQPIIASFDSVVSVANIKQRTFICYSNNSFFYEWLDPNIVPVDLAGLSAPGIIGLVAANSYLIAYSKDTIYWSSILDPADFFPSLETTAGSAKVLAIRGEIIYCTPISDGFLIFTAFNVVSATFSGNERNPFYFKEVAGSFGVDDPEKITKDTNAEVQYISGTHGIARFNRAQMQVYWPEVTEFLSGRRIERFNYSTNKIVEYDILKQLKTKIVLIGQRFLVLSYGYDKLEFALVYDIAFQRWGKLRIDHVDCFEYIGYPEVSDETSPALAWEDLVGSWADQFPKTWANFGGLVVSGAIGEEQQPYKSIAFLKENGQVVIVNFDLPNTQRIGVAMLGKYQLIRGKWIQFLEAWMENVGNSAQFQAYFVKSLDGSSFQDPELLYRDEDIPFRQAKFLGDHVAQSFALLLEGYFDLSSLEIFFQPAGS